MSAVRLAAWMPAMRATASTSPFFTSRLAIAAVVSGFINTLHCATARRWVGSFGRDIDHAGAAQRVEVGEREIGHFRQG